jgi:hypothetical protein
MFNPAIASREAALSTVADFHRAAQYEEKELQNELLLQRAKAREEKLKQELEKSKSKTARKSVTAESRTAPAVKDQELSNILLAMMTFFVGQMNDQNKIEVASAQHLEVVTNNEVKAGEHLNDLNPQLTNDTHIGTATGFCIAGVILGNIAIMVLTLPILPVSYAALGVADYEFFSHLHQVEQSVGDSGPNPAKLEAISGQQQMYGLLGQTDNQQETTDMQSGITQPAQQDSADANMYSRDLAAWQQIASIANR